MTKEQEARLMAELMRRLEEALREKNECLAVHSDPDLHCRLLAATPPVEKRNG